MAEYSTLWWNACAPVSATTLIWKTPSTSTELLSTSTCSEQPPLSESETPRGARTAALWQAAPAEAQERMENNCQAHGICGMLCYLKFLQRRRKLGQMLTITIFYYITINRSSTVWQKNDKFQITSQHILLKTLKILKQTVVFFFFPFFNLMSGMTNIPRSHNQIMEKLDHTAYVPHQIKHNVQNVHVSVYTIQK